MKKIDWSLLVPLGLEGRKIKNRLLLALGISVGWSLRAFFRVSTAVWDLYIWDGAERVLRTDVQMPWFSELAEGAFVAFLLTALCMAPLALMFYLYHYQGSKSIYTMLRLPNRRELRRRCLAMPILCAAACLVLSAVLLLLYYKYYLLVTPEGYALPGQWQHLWEEWLCSN